MYAYGYVHTYVYTPVHIAYAHIPCNEDRYRVIDIIIFIFLLHYIVGALGTRYIIRFVLQY